METSDIPSLLQLNQFFLQQCLHNGCFYDIFVKCDPLSQTDFDLAYDKFKSLRLAVRQNIPNHDTPIKGPLTFVAGDVRVIVCSNRES